MIIILDNDNHLEEAKRADIMLIDTSVLCPVTSTNLTEYLYECNSYRQVDPAAIESFPSQYRRGAEVLGVDTNRTTPAITQELMKGADIINQSLRHMNKEEAAPHKRDKKDMEDSQPAKAKELLEEIAMAYNHLCRQSRNSELRITEGAYNTFMDEVRGTVEKVEKEDRLSPKKKFSAGGTRAKKRRQLFATALYMWDAQATKTSIITGDWSIAKIYHYLTQKYPTYSRMGLLLERMTVAYDPQQEALWKLDIPPPPPMSPLEMALKMREEEQRKDTDSRPGRSPEETHAPPADAPLDYLDVQEPEHEPEEYSEKD